MSAIKLKTAKALGIDAAVIARVDEAMNESASGPSAASGNVGNSAAVEVERIPLVPLSA